MPSIVHEDIMLSGIQGGVMDLLLRGFEINVQVNKKIVGAERN